MNPLESAFAEHPFFRELSEAHRRLIAGCASNANFAAGDYLFREGQRADQFYMLRHGKVAVEVFAGQRGPLVVQTLEQGDILGWSWIVPPHTWRFDARAVELTRTVSLDAECLRGKIEADHELGYQLLRRFAGVMTERLEAARLQLLDMYTAEAP